MRLILNRFDLTVLALLAVSMLALATSTASAAPISKNASVQILNAAYLVTGGVDVTVKYSCAPEHGGLTVHVSQSGSDGAATVPVNCDGQTHSATVLVPGVFTPGQANVHAQVSNVDDTSFAEQFSTITIR